MDLGVIDATDTLGALYSKYGINNVISAGVTRHIGSLVIRYKVDISDDYQDSVFKEMCNIANHYGYNNDVNLCSCLVEVYSTLYRCMKTYLTGLHNRSLMITKVIATNTTYKLGLMTVAL